MADNLSARVTIHLKAVRLGVCLMAGASAVVGGACSRGQSSIGDRPSWGMADKLGHGEAQPMAGSATGPVYDYRGGRDPVTGMVRADAPAGPRLIEIRKGDTLHGLSLTHHVSVKALMEANNLVSTNIVPGKKLIIPAN